VIERLIESWLDSASERSYQSVFVQMLSARGDRVVHSTRHSVLEFGKDVLAIARDGVGCAYQLKGHPKGRLGLAQFRTEIQPQLVQLMSQKVVFPGFPEGPHRSYLVTNGYFEEEVQRAVDDLNRAGYLSRVELISRGELLAWSRALGPALWPSELEDERALLELYLSNPRDSIPIRKLGQLIGEVLLLQEGAEDLRSRADFDRRVTSAALLTGIATYSFAEAKNHASVCSAWVLFSVSVIAACEKHSQALTGATLESVSLAEIAITDALGELWREVEKRENLIEGNALVDPDVYGWRQTLLIGLLSCLAVYNEKKRSLEHDEYERLRAWLLRRDIKIELWGEGAIASVVPWLTWLQLHEPTVRAEMLVATVTRTVVERNQRRSQMPMASPYYSFEEIVRANLELGNRADIESLREDSASGSSYTARPLYHLLVRTNLKGECKALWEDFSRLAHHSCIPDAPWGYCVLEMVAGINSTKLYPLSFQWSDLKAESRRTDDNVVPKLLRSRPWLHALWWQIAPSRYGVESSRVFVEEVCPQWGS
jgi:hypothetical protein